MPRKRQHFGIALKSTGVLQHSATECMGTAGSSKAGQETRREEKVKSTLYCGFRGKEWEQCGKQQLKCITWMTWVVASAQGGGSGCLVPGSGVSRHVDAQPHVKE